MATTSARKFDRAASQGAVSFVVRRGLLVPFSQTLEAPRELLKDASVIHERYSFSPLELCHGARTSNQVAKHEVVFGSHGRQFVVPQHSRELLGPFPRRPTKENGRRAPE